MDGRRPPITPPGHRDLKICSGTGGADGIGGTVGTGGIGGKVVQVARVLQMVQGPSKSIA